MNMCVCAQETERGIVWNSVIKPYKCVVASPKKESKLKGLKSFIAYQLTPTVSIVNIAELLQFLIPIILPLSATAVPCLWMVS
jgi:hypothetical protein